MSSAGSVVPATDPSTGSGPHLVETIERAAVELSDELIAFRRDLHAHPETGFDEVRTTRVIVEALTAAGLAPRVLAIGTGVVCDIEPSEGVEPTGPPLGFRADIDALPIPDGKSVPWASTNPGVCHACGHDVHTTVVLGLGRLLAAVRAEGRLTRPVRLIFQPAEESSPGGGVLVVGEGVLDGLAGVYALHCDPRVDAGQVGLKVGPITSAVMHVTVSLSGPGGHTSRPHLTADLVGALGAVALETPLLLTRRLDPRAGVSMVWGRVEAGTAANAIPDAGRLEGTLRSLTLGGWQECESLLPALVAQIVAPYGVQVEVDITAGVPPTVNHPDGVDRFEAAAAAVLAPGAVIGTEQSMGGEDFAWMLQEVPGALARLGVRTPGATTAADIHTPAFTVDESAIGVGLRLLAALALLPEPSRG